MGSFIDNIGSGLASAFNWVLALLPDSPFQAIDNSAVGQFMGNLNWIIPLNVILAEIEAWLTAVAIYYLYQVVLRWTKAIS